MHLASLAVMRVFFVGSVFLALSLGASIAKDLEPNYCRTLIQRMAERNLEIKAHNPEHLTEPPAFWLSVMEAHLQNPRADGEWVFDLPLSPHWIDFKLAKTKIGSFGPTLNRAHLEAALDDVAQSPITYGKALKFTDYYILSNSKSYPHAGRTSWQEHQRLPPFPFGDGVSRSNPLDPPFRLEWYVAREASVVQLNSMSAYPISPLGWIFDPITADGFEFDDPAEFRSHDEKNHNGDIVRLDRIFSALKPPYRTEAFLKFFDLYSAWELARWEAKKADGLSPQVSESIEALHFYIWHERGKRATPERILSFESPEKRLQLSHDLLFRSKDSDLGSRRIEDIKTALDWWLEHTRRNQGEFRELDAR